MLSSSCNVGFGEADREAGKERQSPWSTGTVDMVIAWTSSSDISYPVGLSHKQSSNS